MDKKEVERRIISKVKELRKSWLDDFDESTKLGDITGSDSFMIIQLIVWIEDCFGVTIPFSDLKDLNNATRIAEYCIASRTK